MYINFKYTKDEVCDTESGGVLIIIILIIIIIIIIMANEGRPKSRN
jgi:hypothetical protein